ncbi:MAG: ECF-type sigma factor [Planctomycetota bacterium]
MASLEAEMTGLLQRATAGDRQARSHLFEAVQQRLHGLAESRLRGESPDLSIQATVLVHDAYLQLVGDSTPIDFADRNHFYVLAAKAMRRILVDHARRKRAAKRGGPHWRRAAVEVDAVGAGGGSEDDVLALHEALGRLAENEPRQAEVVELRHFGGYSVEESAELLGVSSRTVKGDFAAAKAWLYRELSKA